MMHLPRPRHTPLRWPRSHRRTARRRLTTVYGGLFLLFGAGLLALTYLLARERDKPGFVKLSGHELRMVRPSAAGSLHQLQIAVAVYQSGRDLNHLLVESGIALVIMAVLAVILGWIVAGRALRPLSTITTTARRISATNLHERLALEDSDEEFKELGETLDGLFARLEASFEAQRHFVVNASHELRTPLTRERTLLQVALKDPSTPEVWRSTGQKLLASNRQQGTIIEALLALASSEGGLERHENIDLSIVARAVLGADRSEIDRLGIQVDTAITSAPLAGDPHLIERLVANLFDNAIGHNVARGRVHLSTGVKDGRAILSISNTGPVISPAEVDRLFQPFERLDARRKGHSDGHGLGLSIVKAIAVTHGAVVAADAPPSGGLIVDVTFPPAPSIEGGPGKASRTHSTRARRVLTRNSTAAQETEMSPVTSPTHRYVGDQ